MQMQKFKGVAENDASFLYVHITHGSMLELYFLAVIDFYFCCSPRGCASASTILFPWFEDSFFYGNLKIQYKTLKEVESKKARRIRLFQDLQKNSPPKRKAVFVSKFVPLDTPLI